MAVIERMTIRLPDGRSRRLLLELCGESDRAVRGYVVNRQGERIERRIVGTADYSTEYVIAAHADVLRRERMVMNLHYGELEPMPSGSS